MTAKDAYKQSVPFFKLKGRMEISYGMYKDEFEKLSNLLESLKVDHVDYFRGVFYTTWGENFYPRAYSPRNIHTPWAIKKYADYKVLMSKGLVTPLNMERLFIDRTAEYAHKDFFEVQDGLLPKCLEDIRRWNIAPTYVCVHPKFKKIFKQLDKDIQNEYFNVEGLHYLEKRVKQNASLYRYIKDRI